VATDTDDALAGRWARRRRRGRMTRRWRRRSTPFAHLRSGAARASAKKVSSEKAYDLARRDQPMILEPVPVTVHGCSK
jgi:hypothetical protein